MGKQIHHSNPETVAVAKDLAMEQGEIAEIAQVGERVMLYTSSFIVLGTVSRIGPLAYELVHSGIVFDTGPFEEASKGKFKDSQSWPGVTRVPFGSVCFAQVMPSAKGFEVDEGWIKEHGELHSVLNIGERAMLYTSSFIVLGTVKNIGPMVCELDNTSIVFDTGPFEEASKGKFKDSQPWPEVCRVPLGSICFTQIMPAQSPKTH